MLQVEYTTQFKKDLKLAKKRGKNLTSLADIMEDIEYMRPLAKKLRDHPLVGNWVYHRELHIEPDWLLIYKIITDKKTVIFVRTGSHADLFE